MEKSGFAQTGFAARTLLWQDYSSQEEEEEFAVPR